MNFPHQVDKGKQAYQAKINDAAALALLGCLFFRRRQLFSWPWPLGVQQTASLAQLNS